MSPSVYFIFREQSQSFVDIGLYNGDSLSVTGIGEPEQVRPIDVTDGTLPLLGITPLLGRTISREDDLPGKPPTVLLTYGYWKPEIRRVALGDWEFASRWMESRPRLSECCRRIPFHELRRRQLVMPFQFDRAKKAWEISATKEWRGCGRA